MKTLRIVLNNKEGKAIENYQFEGNYFAYIKDKQINIINADKSRFETTIIIEDDCDSYSIYNYD